MFIVLGLYENTSVSLHIPSCNQDKDDDNNEVCLCRCALTAMMPFEGHAHLLHVSSKAAGYMCHD